MPLDQTARLKAREQGYLTVTDWSGRLESCYGLEGWGSSPSERANPDLTESPR